MNSRDQIKYAYSGERAARRGGALVRVIAAVLAVLCIGVFIGMGMVP